MAYQHLSFVDYRNQFYETSDHLLLDVRTEMEFMRGRVPNAVNIPLHQLRSRLDEIDHSSNFNGQMWTLKWFNLRLLIQSSCN